MDGRRLQRLALLAIFVNSVAFIGLASVDRSTASTDASRFAGMPAPEAILAPTASPMAAEAFDAVPKLYRPTARLRAGVYSLRRFNSSGAVIAKRTVSLRYARTFYTLANERTFGGDRHVKLTSGSFAGWWAPAGSTTPPLLVTASQPYTLRITRGMVVAKRFLGPVTVKRSMWLPAASTYSASERARFHGATHYLLSDGPLAGRWVRASRVTIVSSSSTSSVASPAPTATNSTAPTSAPSGAPTQSPTAKPTATPTPAPAATPTATAASTWKAIALVYRETDVTFRRSDGTMYRLQSRMSDGMYDLVRKTLGQTVKSVSGWSGGLAAMNLTVVDVPHPLTKVDELGSAYWVGPQSVQQDMDRYAPTGSYDSIFVVFHPRDSKGVEIPIGGWGLTIPGGSWSNGAGFTSVITPAAMWWWTDSPAPEEVFIHEWLHQVLFFHQDAGRISLDLHAGREYGYNDAGGTWKTWYSDIMQGKVRDGSRLIGLTADIWAAGKPTSR